MVTRRNVLLAGGALAAGGVLAACSTGDASTGEQAAAADASQAAAMPAGTVIAAVADVPVGGGFVNEGEELVVVQPQQGSIQAFTAVCPHQGCLVNEVANNEIVCPCHGSRFSALDGAVISGPAPVGLERVGVVVDGESVVRS